MIIIPIKPTMTANHLKNPTFSLSKKRVYWNKAKKYLANKDKVMSLLIKKYKSPTETVLSTRKDVFYSCLGDDSLLFKNISLLNIIIEDKITSKEPINVLAVGISFQIKYPNIIAKTKAKYFNGVAKLTSENL